MNKVQEIYINLDDSGKLTEKEHISVYGGLIFLSKSEKDKFITQYRSIINDIKCSYCNKKEKCNNMCPEVKNTNIKNSDKRRIMNYLKKYYVIGLIIFNDLVYDHIKSNKAAKGRFIDYAIRRMIKEVVSKLIKNGIINPYIPIKLIINIDEQSTKSNGYYNLHDGLVEELKYGIVNFNYSKKINPIVFSDLDIVVKYQDSEKSYAVQGADLLAGTIRRMAVSTINNKSKMNEELTSFVDFRLYLP